MRAPGRLAAALRALFRRPRSGRPSGSRLSGAASAAARTPATDRRRPSRGVFSRSGLRALAAGLLALAALAAAAPAQAQTVTPIWSSTMTVGTAAEFLGFGSTANFGAMSNPTISHGDHQAEISNVAYSSGLSIMSLNTTSSSSDSYKLCIDGTAISTQFTPFNSTNENIAASLSWTVGQTVQLAMIETSQSCANVDQMPTFGTTTIDNRSTVVDTNFGSHQLPEATGGDGTLTYALTPALPAGLTLDATTRTISGTPTVKQSATTYTWTATDADSDTASLTFTIAVTPWPRPETTPARNAFSTSAPSRLTTGPRTPVLPEPATKPATSVSITVPGSGPAQVIVRKRT